MTKLTKLTRRQREMLFASDPDDITGKEGVAVEIRGGADYAVARSLVRLGVGVIGEACGPSYWNNAKGIGLRAALSESAGRTALASQPEAAKTSPGIEQP